MPDPNSFSGKIILSIFDKVVLALIIVAAGSVVGNYWVASTVGARTIDLIAPKIIANTAKITAAVKVIPSAGSAEKSRLVERVITEIDEIHFWILMGDSVTEEVCKAAFIDTLTKVRDEVQESDMRKSKELAQSIVTTYPTIIDCIKQYQRKSVSITELF